MDDEQFAVTTALIALTRALLVAKAGDRDLLRKHLTSGRKGPAGLRPRPGPHRSAPPPAQRQWTILRRGGVGRLA